jgi:hypothetical protein
VVDAVGQYQPSVKWMKTGKLPKDWAMQACKSITQIIDFNMHSCTIDCISRHFLSRR